MKPHLKNTVVTLFQRNVSQHEIARKTGVDRKTIRKLVRGACALQAPAESNSPLATGVDTQIPPPRPPGQSAEEPDSLHRALPRHARSACEPHREWIEAQVRLGRNAVAIYQELVDRFDFTSRYNSVKRFCRGLKEHEPEQFDRLEFSAGEECQVDYGEGAPTRHPTSGTYRKPRLFVMTLRYSRRSFRKVVWKSSAEIWARLHEEAFRYFGGSCAYVVLDNLREGVIQPDLYEPEINRVYAMMLAHYGVAADPARVRDPNRKGTVESAIQHTQSTALKGKRFESIEEQNTYLQHWEEKWAAPRIHGRAKRQVAEMFEEERPHLKALPIEGFRYFKESVRTVQDDTTIQVECAWYAARPAHIGEQVMVRLYEREIEIRDLKTLELLRRHPRAARKGEVKLPEEERLFNPSRQTQRILSQAKNIGPHTARLCQALFEKRGREAQRQMWGIVGLTSRYPLVILEQAAEVALLRHTHNYKSVCAIATQLLAQAIARIDASSEPSGVATPASALTQQHELIRETGVYADFFKASRSE